MEGLLTKRSQAPKRIAVLQHLISHSPSATSTIPPRYPRTPQPPFSYLHSYQHPKHCKNKKSIGQFNHREGVTSDES